MFASNSVIGCCVETRKNRKSKPFISSWKLNRCWQWWYQWCSASVSRAGVTFTTWKRNRCFLVLMWKRLPMSCQAAIRAFKKIGVMFCLAGFPHPIPLEELSKGSIWRYEYFEPAAFKQQSKAIYLHINAHKNVPSAERNQHMCQLQVLRNILSMKDILHFAYIEYWCKFALPDNHHRKENHVDARGRCRQTAQVCWRI